MQSPQDKPVTVRISFSVDIDRVKFREMHPRLSPTRLSQLRTTIRREAEQAALEFLADHDLLADEG